LHNLISLVYVNMLFSTDNHPALALLLEV